MKALTIIRPWLHAISHGSKRDENRTWKPSINALSFGARFAIHAGNSYDPECLAFCRARGRGVNYYLPPQADSCPTGIVAVATLHNVVTFVQGVDDTRSAWAHGPVSWQLSDVVALPTPVPCRGQQGLWDLPEDVHLQVLGQLEHVGR